MVQDSGCIDPLLLCKHNLTTLSEPKDVIEALFPYKENKYYTKKERLHEHQTVDKIRYSDGAVVVVLVLLFDY